MIAAGLILLLAAGQTPPASFPSAPATMEQIQASHIDGNVPPREVFDLYLARDLTAYFAAEGLDAPSVEYDLLRQGPTQSGMSWPKYYLWVRVRSGGTLKEGAVRVAAQDKVRFEVTDFLERSEIIAEPDRVIRVFPAALVGPIQARANGRR